MDDLAARSFPSIPETREAEGALVLHTEEEGLLFTIRSLPLVKTIRWDDAASLLECFAKRRLLLNRLAAAYGASDQKGREPVGWQQFEETTDEELATLDEALFETAPRSAFHLGEEFITTNSLTKVYGLSGLRCGWILARAELAEKLWHLNDLFGVIPAHSAERLSCIALAHLGGIGAGCLLVGLFKQRQVPLFGPAL